MTFLYIGQDGKIRFRCQYCGKKVKVGQDAAGKVFKCPRCNHVIMAPLPITEEEDGEAENDADVPQDVLKPQVNEDYLLEKTWKPTGVVREKNREIERLFRTLNRENLKALEKFENVLANEEATDEQKMVQLQKIAARRREAIREHIRMIIAEYDIQLEQLENNPMRKQSRIVHELQRIRRERREFLMAVGALFGRKAAGGKEESKGASEEEGAIAEDQEEDQEHT